MKPEQWIVNGEVGTSSNTIWAVMMGAVMENNKDAWWRYDVPHDPDDFSRCWKLLMLFPEWRKRLSEVASIFPKWIPFVKEWDKLTRMYEQNLADNPNGYGYCHEMMDFMTKLEQLSREVEL